MLRSLNRLGGNHPSPPQRLSVLLAALLLTVLQVIAVSHLIGHSASGGDTGNCELCLNAVHGGDALVAAGTPPPAFHALAGRLVVAPSLQVSSRTPTVCRARGPPSSA